MSFAPIIIPIILILLNTESYFSFGVEGVCDQFNNFIGAPVSTVGMGLIISIYGLAGRFSKGRDFWSTWKMV